MSSYTYIIYAHSYTYIIVHNVYYGVLYYTLFSSLFVDFKIFVCFYMYFLLFFKYFIVFSCISCICFKYFLVCFEKRSIILHWLIDMCMNVWSPESANMKTILCQVYGFCGLKNLYSCFSFIRSAISIRQTFIPVDVLDKFPIYLLAKLL